ncbi:protein phosphatase 2C 55 [Pyrus ussuriensis x Pyrus communis]|uniref:Protein phosphatase n=1 Tax=Pyrus ussuriensis x Pyrus communis TaxID=2448454 RepID=A0A5N5HHQ8_9ROSA|nr:protein phosphatase 2C 55 [Pyrus ussuriensis x Pyrus communis]
MVCGKLYIAKENSERREGEDAHFICMEKQTIGVADGVGSWAKYGIDAHVQLYVSVGNGINNDNPDSAWEKKDIQTVPGDIIVLGTDGLLGNMFPSEIEEVLVANSTSNSKDRESDRSGGDGDGDFDCDALASSIANLALYNSFDKYNPSPFSENAKKAGFEYVGGKIDDITVIVR